VVDEVPAALSDAVVCAACGRKLLPLTYTRLSSGSDAMAREKLPHLKCAGCGRPYHWTDAAGWRRFVPDRPD
jgi:hypothetical protein